MKITEQNFITQIIQGNERALEYCMYHYGGLVRAVVRRHLGNLAKFEEECINDVFFAVWEHADSYRSDKNPFSNWIAGAARLKALDCKRRYARHLLEVGWEDNHQEIMGREKQDRQMPELSILENEISVETEKMLSCLKPADRELFWKLYVEEEDLDTVSRTMGMSKSVIYNHLSRGKKKLRNLYGMQPKGDQL